MGIGNFPRAGIARRRQVGRSARSFVPGSAVEHRMISRPRRQEQVCRYVVAFAVLLSLAATMQGQTTDNLSSSAPAENRSEPGSREKPDADAIGEQDGVCYCAMQYICGVGHNEVFEDVRRLRYGHGATEQTSVVAPVEKHSSQHIGHTVSAAPLAACALLSCRFEPARVTPAEERPVARREATLRPSGGPTVDRDANRPVEEAA
jgi:hypothetical protein